MMTIPTKHDAALWRRAQAKEVIIAFARGHGRLPKSQEELAAWVALHPAELSYDDEGKIIPSPEAIAWTKTLN
jgi:hypothetical protein